MTLIADSGSTKTAWCAINPQGDCRHLATTGINPYYMEPDDIIIALRSLAEQVNDDVHHIYFYGAGIASIAKAELMKQCCTKVFSKAHAEAYTDLVGAARALCGKTAGIAGILGTGSNSCFYNGHEIVDAVPPCGFILGDEGSGAALGKQFIADFLKRRLPKELHDLFHDERKLTKEDILEKVYREPFPNRFLASFTTFLHTHQKHEYVHNMLSKHFDTFFTHNIMHYDYTRYPVHLLGSVALYFQDIIKETARVRSIHIGRIEKTAMPGLLTFHAINK
jgi:N-acetylglucosamine kinase-like BadF-type ATPase